MEKHSVGELRVPGQPREGGRGTQPPVCTYVASCSPAGKHIFSFLEDFCHFPARRSRNARSRDCRAFNRTCGASLGLRQEGWRLLLNQIPPLTSVLAQGTYLKVTSRLSRSLPAPRSPQSRTGRCPPASLRNDHSLQGDFLGKDIPRALPLWFHSLVAIRQCITRLAGLLIPISWSHVPGGDSDFTPLKGKR